MPEIHTSLIETSVDGPRTRRWVIEAKECAELAARRIARIGLDEALPPYRRVRLNPGGSFVLACLNGSGRMLLDGRWQRLKAGAVALAPPRVVNAFHAEGSARWVFAWMRYDEPSFVTPLVGAESPVLITGRAQEVARAIEGLRAEWTGARDPKLLHHWVELAHAAARRAAQPWQVHPRVNQLWVEVERDLSAAWTLPMLARQLHCSPEQLRRLCLKELGRSPMQHLTSLRMREARRLLETSDDKLEVIAEVIGYENATVLSRVFKRWVGCSPGEYRKRGG